jgi:hypothetical protein
MTYFKRGLNPNIAAAIEGKYFKSMRCLLSCAIKEKKKIVKVQQDKFTRCINLCQDICAKLQPTISSVVGEKQALTPCTKRGHAIPKVSTVDSSAKRGEDQQFKYKNSVVQQEDNSMSQVDKENDEVCDIALDHSVTPSIGIVAIPKCHLQSEVDEKDVNNISVTGCLNFEQDREEKSAAHAHKLS